MASVAPVPFASLRFFSQSFHLQKVITVITHYNDIPPLSIALLYSLCRAGGVERRRREPSEVSAQRGERHVTANSGSVTSARARPIERPVRHARTERYWIVYIILVYLFLWFHNDNRLRLRSSCLLFVMCIFMLILIRRTCYFISFCLHQFSIHLINSNSYRTYVVIH